MKRSSFTVFEALRTFKENVYYACEEIESSNLGYVNPQRESIHSFTRHRL